ncbi:integrase core domain-containing protein [uncultured Gimesia sp.]|uniref:integrase core domain-containing protein n=1 Tax=uncultured Gimesia sp. TaxID=1678688 RepID=UPI0030D6F14E|tara:strand:+ start:1704 stop:2273 length:570 start_codon:yes stop_codon:yes gene_type:complete
MFLDCNCFSIKSATTKGVRILYLMVFLCLQTREAIATESAEHPKSAWVCEQTLKFIEQSRGREIKPAMIIHDRDGKYTKEFTETMQQSGIKTNPLPIASPNLNGRCERFIETIKLECLAKFIIFGKQHLDHLVSEFTTYYNMCRSHTARDHLPPIREIPNEEVEKLSPDEVQVISHIGGLVKSFERNAA